MRRYAHLDGHGTVRNLYAGQAPNSVPCDDDRVGPGWTWDGTTWSPPGLDLDAAIAAIDEHVSALLAAGVVVEGVRLSLATDDRLDWLGLRAMAGALLAAAGGELPVVGVDGAVLVLRSVEQIAAVTDALATHRLYLQALSAGARTQVRAATTGAARAAIVDAFRAVS